MIIRSGMGQEEPSQVAVDLDVGQIYDTHFL